MTAVDLVSVLRGRGVELWLESQRLHYRGIISDEEREALRAQKPAVLRLLAEGGPGEGCLTKSADGDVWEAMRRLAPYLGLPVRLDGHDGFLWGLTPHGGIFDTGTVLLTVDHASVETP